MRRGCQGMNRWVIKGNPWEKSVYVWNFQSSCLLLSSHRFINRSMQEKLVYKVMSFPGESQEMVRLKGLLIFVSTFCKLASLSLCTLWLTSVTALSAESLTPEWFPLRTGRTARVGLLYVQEMFCKSDCSAKSLTLSYFPCSAHFSMSPLKH